MHTNSWLYTILWAVSLSRSLYLSISSSRSVVLCNHRDYKPRISAHGKRHLFFCSLTRSLAHSLRPSPCISFLVRPFFIISYSCTLALTLSPSHTYTLVRQSKRLFSYSLGIAARYVCGSVGRLSFSFLVRFEMLGREHLSFVTPSSNSVEIDDVASFQP